MESSVGGELGCRRPPTKAEGPGWGQKPGPGWPVPPAPLSSLLQEAPPVEPAQGRARAPPSPG